MRRVQPLLRSPAVLFAQKNPESLDDVTKGNGAAAPPPFPTPTKILHPFVKTCGRSNQTKHTGQETKTQRF